MSLLMADSLSLQRIAAAVTDAQLDLRPELRARYGVRGRQHCIDDTLFHLTYLGEAVRLGDPTLFEDYVSWAKVMLASRGVGADDLAGNLGQLRDGLSAEAGDRSADAAVRILDHVLDRLPSMPALAPPATLSDAARRYLACIRAGDRRGADAVVEAELASGASVPDVYLGIFEPVQHEIGRLWQVNEISVAQEHFCTAAVQRSMSQLSATLFGGAPRSRRVVAACAGGELHEVGLRMVTDLLEADGWDTVYLGANVPAGGIVKTVAEEPTALVAISATITPNLRALASIIEALRRTPATALVPVIVGGYPFRVSASLAERVGASAWASNAAEAVRCANSLTA